MTKKQFYDWQTAGGTDDVMRLVDSLERADIRWCTIGGIAVNHWAAEPLVTQYVDFAVAAGDVERAIGVLGSAGFQAERFPWSVNFLSESKLRIQLSTQEVYLDFPERFVSADVHGVLLRVASLEDTLTGKILAWSDTSRRESKRLKDFADIARLVESHPQLCPRLPDTLRGQIDPPPS